jgi:hypothetical protein
VDLFWDLITQEIANAVPLDDKGFPPKQLCCPLALDIQHNIGAMIYQSSKVTYNGLMDKAIGLAYAKTEDGEEAAKHVIAAFEDGKGAPVSLYCGLPCMVVPFPKQTRTN